MTKLTLTESQTKAIVSHANTLTKNTHPSFQFVKLESTDDPNQLRVLATNRYIITETLLTVEQPQEQLTLFLSPEMLRTIKGAKGSVYLETSPGQLHITVGNNTTTFILQMPSWPDLSALAPSKLLKTLIDNAATNPTNAPTRLNMAWQVVASKLVDPSDDKNTTVAFDFYTQPLTATGKPQPIVLHRADTYVLIQPMIGDK